MVPTCFFEAFITLEGTRGPYLELDVGGLRGNEGENRHNLTGKWCTPFLSLTHYLQGTWAYCCLLFAMEFPPSGMFGMDYGPQANRLVHATLLLL